MTGMRVSLLVGSFALAAAAHGADLAAGQAKAKEICQACHGLDGNSTVADYPKLGGQYPDYLAKALRDYKSGERDFPTMRAIAAPLTDDEMQKLANYYASAAALSAQAEKK